MFNIKKATLATQTRRAHSILISSSNVGPILKQVGRTTNPEPRPSTSAEINFTVTSTPWPCFTKVSIFCVPNHEKCHN